MFPGMVEGVWKDSGALEKSSSAALKAKIHWKGSWQILCSGGVGEAYRRDTKCMQKVKRLFSSGRRGRWGGWKSRWWQRGRAEQVPNLKLQPRTTHYRLFWLLFFFFMFRKWKIQLLHSPRKESITMPCKNAMWKELSLSSQLGIACVLPVHCLLVSWKREVWWWELCPGIPSRKHISNALSKMSKWSNPGLEV